MPLLQGQLTPMPHNGDQASLMGTCRGSIGAARLMTKSVSHYLPLCLRIESKLGVTAITNWCLARRLTAAEEDLTIRFRCVLHGGKIRTLMASITEGLLVALTAGTPEVTLPSFNFSGVWRLLRDDRL